MRYYAMIIPSKAGDWGEVILVDERIADFVEDVTYIDKDSVDYVLEKHKDNLEFIQEQLDSQQNLRDFVLSQNEKWSDMMSDNYYRLSALDSTLQFYGVAGVVAYVKDSEIELVGDLI